VQTTVSSNGGSNDEGIPLSTVTFIIDIKAL